MNAKQRHRLTTVAAKGADQVSASLAMDFPGASDISFTKTNGSVRIERSLAYIGGGIVGSTKTSGHKYRVPDHDTYGFLCPNSGSFSAEVAGRTYEAAANKGALLSYGPSHKRSLSEGSNGIFLLVPRPVLLSYARGLDSLECELDGPRELSMASNISRALRRNVSAIYHEIVRLSQDGLSGLGDRLNCEHVYYLLLLAMMPDRFGRILRVNATQSRDIVSRSQEFMTENVCEDISLFGLAQDLGVNLRTLQLSFRRETGLSPMQFLMEQRLIHARQMLSEGALGVITVTSVAEACRFSNPGAFARRYSLRFGERPSDTLRQTAAGCVATPIQPKGRRR